MQIRHTEQGKAEGSTQLPAMQKATYRNVKGYILQCKRTLIAAQKDAYCNAKDVLPEGV